MKEGWKTQTLGELAEITAGNSAPQDESLFRNGKYPFFRMADAGRIRFGDIYESTDYLNEEGVKGLRRFPKGTILFPKSGASTFLNHRVMLGVEGCVSSHLATIVADETKVDRRFLLYYLTTVVAQDLIQDHAYPSLNLPTIAGISVPAPPLPEQRRIVGVLDEAFDGIAIARANAEKNLQSARELFESYLHSMFANPGEDWEEKKLGDVCEIDTGKWNADHAVEGGAYRFYTCAKEYCFSETKRFSGECLILPGNGVNVGDVYYYDGEFDAYQRTYVLSNIKPSARFVYYHMLFYWRSRNLDKQFGSATNFIKIGNFLDYEIPLPSLAGQRTIVAKLDAFSSETGRLEDVYQRKLDTLEDLKKSLLSAAFDGEL